MSDAKEEAKGRWFPTTLWSKIIRAQSYDEDERMGAMAILLGHYWRAGFLFLAKRFSWGAGDIETAMDVFHDFVEAKLRCSAVVLESDVPDVKVLAARLREPQDEIVGYLRGRLSLEAREKLDADSRTAVELEGLKPVLIADLNRILREEVLWNQKAFGEKAWSERTGQVLERVRQKPPRNPLRVNRMLLDEVFPRELIAFDDFFGRVQREKGRFRSYFATSLVNWSAQKFRARKTIKGGGGALFIPLPEDVAADEDLKHRLTEQLTAPLTAEQVFHRQFAEDLVFKSAKALEAEYDAAGKGAVFRALEEESKPCYPALAKRFQMKEPALRKLWQRINRRRRQLIREGIIETMDEPTEEAVREEQQQLFAALGGDTRRLPADIDNQPGGPPEADATVGRAGAGQQVGQDAKATEGAA